MVLCWCSLMACNRQISPVRGSRRTNTPYLREWLLHVVLDVCSAMSSTIVITVSMWHVHIVTLWTYDIEDVCSATARPSSPSSATQTHPDKKDFARAVMSSRFSEDSDI